MKKLDTFSATTVVIDQDNVDTDQIIPARFLTTTSSEGFGDALFADWRFDDNGEPVAGFALNQPEAESAEVLVAGSNFGCGSSREHAPWALRDFGFKAVVSNKLADIFASNCQKCGVLPVVVPDTMHRWLLDHPGCHVDISVSQLTLTANGQTVNFPLDGFARHCFLNGVDALGYLLDQESAIATYEAAAL